MSDIDALLLPGDFGDKMSKEGVSEAWDLAKYAAGFLGAKHLIPVVGNHDVDSHKKLEYVDRAHVVKVLRHDFPFADQRLHNDFFSQGFCIFQSGPESEVIAINTVVDHYDPDSGKRGAFEPHRVAILEAALKTSTPRFRVALMH